MSEEMSNFRSQSQKGLQKIVMKKVTSSLPLLMLPLLVGLSGCLPKLDETEEVITWDHFATGFIEKPTFTVAQDYRTDLLWIQSTQMVPGPKESAFKDCVTIFDESQRPRVAKYAETFGDKVDKPFTYKGLVRNGGAPVPIHFYYATPVSSITITSDIAWSKSLPAGSDLASEFAYFTGCSDRFAKEHKKYSPKEPPTDFPIQNAAYREILQRNFANQSSVTEVLYGKLSDLDLTSRDYVGISTVFMILGTDNAEYRKPQTLTVKMAFRDGQTATSKVRLNQHSQGPWK